MSLEDSIDGRELAQMRRNIRASLDVMREKIDEAEAALKWARGARTRAAENFGLMEEVFARLSERDRLERERAT